MKKVILALAVISISGVNVYKFVHGKTATYSDMQLENIELLYAFGEQILTEYQDHPGYGCTNAAYQWIPVDESDWTPNRVKTFQRCGPDCPPQKGVDPQWIKC